MHLFMQLVAQNGFNSPSKGVEAWLYIVLGVLLAIDLFIPFYLYIDATKRKKNGLPWIAGSFFSLFVLGVLAIVSGEVWVNATAFYIFAVLAFLTPFVIMFVYLILRTPAVQRICPVCGNELQASWRACPYCEEAGAAAPGVVPQGSRGAVFVPPSASQASATSVGRRSGGDRSTMVKPREEKRTIRKRDKEAGPTLGWLVIKSGHGAGKEYKITKESTTIGRETSGDVVVSDDEASRQHARLRFENGKFILFDLGSANGTQVNGEEIQKTLLEDGDIVRIGETELTFKKM